MAASSTIVLDDRLLIEELLVGVQRKRAAAYTTTYWYYRACRAAALGAGGHLSGPFALLDAPEQSRAVQDLLDLSADISLPDPRPTVPAMVDLARHHPRLNLLNLEAVAVGRLLRATLWLSPESAAGVLPEILDEERVAWQVVPID